MSVVDDRGRCPCCGSLVRAGVGSQLLSALEHAGVTSLQAEAVLDFLAAAHIDEPGETDDAAPARDRDDDTFAVLAGAASGASPVGFLEEGPLPGARLPEAARWWMPSLIRLAWEADRPTTGTPDADRDARRDTLEGFARSRDRYSYAVVEERTDTVIGLTVQRWPLMDARGRPRFEIDIDPLDVEVDEELFSALLRTHRQRWSDLGLMTNELVGRAAQIGDTFAVVVSVELDDDRLVSNPAGPPFDDIGSVTVPGGEGGTVTLSGLDDSDPPLPVIDISWDAREIGKLAYHAAAGGVVDPERPGIEAAMIDEVNARYLTQLGEKMGESD